MLYGIYFIKYYYCIINENNFALMSQLRQAPNTNFYNSCALSLRTIQ